MALAGTRSTSGSALIPWPLRWRDGLGFASGVSVVPHYDAWPEPFSALIALQAPRGWVVLGIDEETAVVGTGRGVAGPRPVAGHGLARPPSRAIPAGEAFRSSGARGLDAHGWGIRGVLVLRAGLPSSRTASSDRSAPRGDD